MNLLVMILFVFVFTTLFGVVLVLVSSFLGPSKKHSEVKKQAYECGIKGQTTGHTQVSVKFYLTAILFILFDIEIIFMYPWAVAYLDFIEKGQGAYIFLAMALFLALFILGLFWEIKSKALEWN